MSDTNGGTIWFPNKRVIRTVLQTITGIILALASGLAVFMLVAPQVLEAVQEVLPPTWYVWLVGFVAAVGTFAGVLAKIMAIPQVDLFLKNFGAGSAPAKVDLPDAVQEEVDRAVVRVATDPIETQVTTVAQAASRLGISPDQVLRDDWRDATGTD